MTDSPLHRLAEQGQSVWIDYLSRDFLRPEGLERMVREDALAGVTSNPTIFQKAIAGSDSYDEQLREVLDAGAGPKEAFYELAMRDVADACDVLRPVWERGSGRDGFVSLEVDPNLAYEAEGTVAEALDLHERVERPNLLVKIPATRPGLAAIEDVIAQGRSVNVTLCFSLRRHREVAESYVRGLERLVAAGGDPASVASVASFFVSRVDTETDRRLDELGGPGELKGRLAVANAKLAYQGYREAFSGQRWELLVARGATPQRCLWASTSTKDPAYPDVMYVEQLIGPETVNTMPEETLRAFADHGTVAPTLERDLDRARAVFDEVAAAGVDYDDVTRVLEAEGVRKFADSFDQLLGDIRAKGARLSAA
ncbi:MAG: transaldolase [Actinomycetota bacterium]|nr:transaldolase [Actinomycetota bacterium]